MSTASSAVDLTRGGHSSSRRDRDREAGHRSQSHKPSRPSSSSSSSSHQHRSSSSHKASSAVTTPSSSSSSLSKKPSQFQYDLHYNNTLPLPPAVAKHLKLPLSKERLWRLAGGGLLSEQKHEIIVDQLMNLPIDMIDTEPYNRPIEIDRGALTTEDAALLTIPITTTSNTRTTTPAATTTKGTFFQLPTKAQLFKQGYSNWARKPEYTSNNLFEKGNTQIALVDVRKQQIEEINRRKAHSARTNTRESQIERIEQTFIEAQQQPIHRTKPELQPIEILPVLPHDGLEHEYHWIEYDYDPLTGNTTHIEPSTISADITNPTENILLPAATDERQPSQQQPSLTQQHQQEHRLYIRQGLLPSHSAADVSTSNTAATEPSASYLFSRDYTVLPTPLVESDNNYFFVLTTSSLLYSRYHGRMRLGKRMRKAAIQEEEMLMEKRAKYINVHWGDEHDDHNTLIDNSNETTTTAASSQNNGEGEADSDARSMNGHRDGEADRESFDAIPNSNGPSEPKL